MMRRWGVIAAAGDSRAQEFADQIGCSPTLLIGRDEILADFRGLRSRVVAEGITDLVIHTTDWRRQATPQLFGVALGLLPARRRFIGCDLHSTHLTPVSRARLLASSAVDAAASVPAALRAAAQRVRYVDPRSEVDQSRDSVLAIWRGSLADVGGSTTHISGILGGFRKKGLAPLVATAVDLPIQLAAVADEVAVSAPLAARYRVSSDLAAIAANQGLRAAALSLATSRQPRFVYQRNDTFLDAGIEIADELGVPLVLEWNGSVVWTREHWESVRAVERIFDRRLRETQRAALTASALVVAVSEAAAEMAVAEGARPSDVIVVPNGVDLDEVNPSLGSVSLEQTVGWIGSFGPWHGAEVLVEAIPFLDPDVRVVFVGDGETKRRCEDRAAELGVDSRISWCGSLKHDDALRTLASCNVLASPHVPLHADQPFFGSPTKIFEYMALGRPIVASRIGQLAEVIEDGRTGVLVEPGSAESLAAGIAAVLHLADKGESLGLAARAEAELRHGWESRAQRILDGLDVRSPS